MPGSFNSKHSGQENIYTIIRGVFKKVFFMGLFLYFISLVTQQLGIPFVERFFDQTVLLGIVLAGFIFMLTFTERESKEPRISRSDWALIGLFGTITIGLNVIIVSDLGIIGLIASVILLLFALGLILYVWAGSDEQVTFSLFRRDRRYKFSTYMRETAKEWGGGLLAILLLLTLSFVFSKNVETTLPIVTTTTPVPTAQVTQELTTPTLNPTQETIPTPTVTNAPTPTPTPVPPSSLPSEYKVYVLNGSGVSGVANEIRSLLEQNGVAVHYAGDASTFDYTQTQILYNAEYSTLADAIFQILTPQYENIQKMPFSPGQRYNQYNLVIIHGQE